MSRIKAFFRNLSNHRANCYCSCGHMVSSNLAFCPFCGRRMADHKELPDD